MPAKKSPTVTTVEARISEHEAVCAERYAGIIYRMNRIEKVIIGSAVILICSMATIIWNTAFFVK